MKSGESILIYGAGPHGRVVLDILQACGKSVSGWLDDNPKLWGTERDGLPILGGADYLRDCPGGQAEVVVAIGINSVRMELARRIVDSGGCLINAIHPSAVIAGGVQLGSGICICAGAVVGTRASIGHNVIVNTAAALDHDCRIEEGAWIAPGVSTGGGVHVGRAAYVSTGAVLLAGVSIGEGAVVAAGAVATAHVPQRKLVMGVPARIVRDIDSRFDFRRLVSGVPSNQ